MSLPCGKSHLQSKTILGGIIVALAPLAYYVVTTYFGDETLAELIRAAMLSIGGPTAAVGIRQAIGKG